MSIQDLRQNPQDVSNFYLANIYQATINPSAPNISSSLPASPPLFSPPTYAVWVNALWFMSLVISLTCALLATFLQQWARRFLKVTHSHLSPDKRARLRAFFAEGVEKCLLPFAVEISHNVAENGRHTRQSPGAKVSCASAKPTWAH